MKRELKKQQLSENCDEINGKTDFDKMSLYEYVKVQADNDACFFRWLFDDNTISDFGENLTEDQKKEYDDFLKTL